MRNHEWDIKRRRVLAAVAVACLGVCGLVAAKAYAATRPSSEYVLMLQLNGTPTKVGTLVSAAGASITNAATSTPFTISSGTVYMVECTVAANVGMGSAAHATASNAAYMPKVNAAPDRTFLIANGTTMAMIPSAGAAGDCAVFQMVSP